jgi:uncharacterized membrane protein
MVNNTMEIGLIIGLMIILAAILIALMSRPLNLNKGFYIKLFFGLFLITALCSLLSFFTSFAIVNIIGSLCFFFIFAFVLLHSSKVLGNKKTIIFFIITLFIGLFSEVLCVKYGWIFGQYYYTNPFFFGLVPFTIPFLWAVLIYTSYIMANLFLFAFGGEKPKKTDNFWYFIGMLILISSISGLITVNLDLLVEPITAFSPVPDWVWIVGGPYFGVPISNFVGWFFVTVVAIFIFRLYEAFNLSSKDLKALNKSLYLYILIIYLFYFLNNAFKAFTLGKVEFVLIGVTTMFPFILIGLLALMVNKDKESEQGIIND